METISTTVPLINNITPEILLAKQKMKVLRLLYMMTLVISLPFVAIVGMGGDATLIYIWYYLLFQAIILSYFITASLPGRIIIYLPLIPSLLMAVVLLAVGLAGIVGLFWELIKLFLN